MLFPSTFKWYTKLLVLQKRMIPTLNEEEEQEIVNHFWSQFTILLSTHFFFFLETFAIIHIVHVYMYCVTLDLFHIPWSSD
jgi:hypothetical protein